MSKMTSDIEKVIMPKIEKINIYIDTYIMNMKLLIKTKYYFNRRLLTKKGSISLTAKN